MNKEKLKIVLEFIGDLLDEPIVEKKCCCSEKKQAPAEAPTESKMAQLIRGAKEANQSMELPSTFSGPSVGGKNLLDRLENLSKRRLESDTQARNELKNENFIRNVVTRTIDEYNAKQGSSKVTEDDLGFSRLEDMAKTPIGVKMLTNDDSHIRFVSAGLQDMLDRKNAGEVTEDESGFPKLEETDEKDNKEKEINNENEINK